MSNNSHAKHGSFVVLSPSHSHRFTKMLACCTAILLAILGATAIPSSPSQAAAITDWQPGNIISDANFYTQGSMSASDIQNFLNKKGSGCSGDRCLKNYRGSLASFAAGACPKAVQGGSNLTAAEMIYRVSSSCNISAKVLLVTLEKENSLVSSRAWYNSRTGANGFRTAMGYGCPDTAACDSQYFGVGNQIYHAAKQFNNYKNHPTWYNHRAKTSSWVGYNPSSSCGGTYVYMQNAATAGLYNYTPYQPNSAALRAGFGTGDSCSTYGNRNFYQLYKNWFGDPRSSSAVRTVTSAQIAALSPVYASAAIKPGEWSERIKKVQRAMLLAVPSFPLFGIDGGYGEKTTAIVKDYQAAHSLEITGEIDQATSYSLVRNDFPIYVATAHTYYGTMKQGANGDAVATLQIGAKGLYPQWFQATPDKSYGAKTAAFVIQFQKSQGLAATGEVDSGTAQALQKAGIPVFIKEIPNPEPIYLDHTLWNYEWSLDVLQVQRALVKYWPQYAQFEPDGGFGPLTEAAVKDVQRANGIYPDGGVGVKTLSLFRSKGIEADMYVHSNSSSVLRYGVWDSREVMTLQQGLRKHFASSFPYNPDGAFGSGTEAGVKAAQAYFGLAQTGIVDKATADKFRSLGVPLTVAEPPAAMSRQLSLPIKYGQWNQDVLAMQQILKYYFPVQTQYSPDGGFGAKTESGLIAVQNLVGAKATGIFDAQTAALLQANGVPLQVR